VEPVIWEEVKNWAGYKNRAGYTSSPSYIPTLSLTHSPLSHPHAHSLRIVELGAPKPIVLSICYSMRYNTINLTIPHKNNTDMGFGSDFIMTRLIYLTF
jgi:hypothetical protein